MDDTGFRIHEIIASRRVLRVSWVDTPDRSMRGAAVVLPRRSGDPPSEGFSYALCIILRKPRPAAATAVGVSRFAVRATRARGAASMRQLGWRCRRDFNGLGLLAFAAAALAFSAGAATAADRSEPGIQPRHPADPGRELLRLPRARQRRPQGRPAARPPRGRHRGRRHRRRASPRRAS